MKDRQTVFETLQAQGVSRRQFMKFCAVTASSLALSGKTAQAFAQALGSAPRPSVIWMSFQQCTGCSESLLRSFNPNVENLILSVISLDYHESLQVAAGHQAEQARANAIAANRSRGAKHILVVDGSIPTAENEWWMAVAGRSAIETLTEAMTEAEIVIALGTCATFGGIPAAYPNPSKAMGVDELMAARLIPTMPLVNISGCPPDGARLLQPPRSLQQRPLRQLSRRRGGEAGLLPLHARLPGAIDLQRMHHSEMERGDEFPHALRPWLHRVLRAQVLGQDARG
ncbi:MAG: Ni/Fe hydrogenase [Proteobacteria bacterium]|nr:Ni/Fe hydrogenase [Pseudomonadota bacterium]